MSELRGVIAHEFGHYVGGETRLAPLIYRTRVAIGRTIFSLSTSSQWFQQVLTFPFIWYGRLYLRVTQAVSRRQELDADRMAAQIAGGTSMESGLVKTHAAGLAFSAYINELGAVLTSGSRPPVAEGFSRFLEGTETRAALARATEEELRHGTSDPYDSHPALRVRLAVLKLASRQPALVPDPAAIGLLRNEPALEVALLDRIVRLEVPSLEAIEWADIGSVWLKIWRHDCERERKALAGITTSTLPLVCQAPSEHVARLRPPRPGMKRVGVLASVLGAALTVVLAERGWGLDARPGEPVTVSAAGFAIKPFEIVRRLMDGDLSEEDWRRICAEAGIVGIHLAEAGVSEATVDAEPGPATPPA